MVGSWIGILMGAAICGGFLGLFHHYVMRVVNARACLARGGVLVDVDTAGEFARHHPRIAVNIPLEDLARRAHELGGRERPIVVFAHSYWRGARAVFLLRGMGQWEVMNAAGLETKESLDEEAARAGDVRFVDDLVELTPADRPPGARRAS